MFGDQTPSKTCNKCKSTKPLTEFHKKSASRDGRDSRCKSCVLDAQVKSNPPTSDPKTCTRCNLLKAADEFAKNRRTKDGRCFECNDCARERKQARFDANPEAERARRRKYYAANAEAARTWNRAYYAANADAERARGLKHKYGLTVEDYDRILEGQLGLCANPGCSNEPTENDERFHVDHDHNCCPGKRSCGHCIRGILCGPCNRSLGQLCDDPKRLRGLADYVESRAIV